MGFERSCTMTHLMAPIDTDESPVLGDNIRTLREEAEWTQVQLSVHADVGINTVQRAEASNPNVSYKNIVKIARALQVEPSAIYLPTVSFPEPLEPPAWAKQFIEQTISALDDLKKQLDRIERAGRGKT
jgi:transcriptional regulator with XRE-family HTH domain